MPTPEQQKVYLEKIGFVGNVSPTLANLTKIVEGHIFTFPFETIDIHDSRLDNLPNRGTFFDFDYLFNKAINHNRGGHCAVLNYLLLEMLKSFGFNAIGILPDNVYKMPEQEHYAPHCAIIVKLNNEDYLVDAGFGALGILSPLPLKEGIYQQYSEKFKIEKDKKYDYSLYILNRGKWEHLFGIFHKEASKQDFAKVNKVESNPLNKECGFTHSFLCTKPFKMSENKNGRIRIINDKIIIYENEELVLEKKFTTQKSLSGLLKQHFNIDIGEGEIRFTPKEQSTYLEKRNKNRTYLPLLGTRRRRTTRPHPRSAPPNAPLPKKQPQEVTYLI